MSANAQPPSSSGPSIVGGGVQAADAWLRRFQAAVVGSMAVVAAGVGAVAFFTSFEAIKAYAKVSGGIAAEHSWAVPLLVDSFIVMATGADLWLSAAKSRRWWETCWPKLLLAGAAAVSFLLNVAHADAAKWSARGVAAIPPAALVLSVELLVLIVRRAAMARIARLSAAGATTEVAWGDHTTAAVVAATGPPALEATTATNPSGGRSRDHGRQARGERSATATAVATGSDPPGDGATYRRVRELYLGGMTVAADIARELGLSASYAQRTLRRVKRDLPQQTAERGAARSPKQATIPDREATSDSDRQETTSNDDGRPTTDRHLALVAPDRDHDRGKGVER
jgi:hypothetical protein